MLEEGPRTFDFEGVDWFPENENIDGIFSFYLYLTSIQSFHEPVFNLCNYSEAETRSYFIEETGKFVFNSKDI